MSCPRLFLLTVLISHVCSIPQFISFKDGKLGVNFAGFHAGIGIGGSLDDSGTTGGLFAEAGTPFGQSAKAGLGGSMDEKGGIAGRVFAGASGAHNVKVSAGLSGTVNGEKTSGGGFATAQAGDRVAISAMNGETAQTITQNKQPLEVKPIHEKDETRIDSANEVKPLEYVPLNNEARAKVHDKQQQDVVEKHNNIVHNKLRRHNFHKTAFLGGHIGPGGEVIRPGENGEAVRRIDIDQKTTVNGDVNSDTLSTDGTTIIKEVTYQKNPTFFADIFNIPISTLKAVGSLLSNTATNTKISVQKSASIETADSDSILEKRHPSSDSSSSAHISVETPSASKFIDDIIAIPINTLGAVNKFLENNIAGRKNIQVRREGGEPTRVRLGPHARRRANKQVVVIHEGEKEIKAEA